MSLPQNRDPAGRVSLFFGKSLQSRVLMQLPAGPFEIRGLEAAPKSEVE